LNFTKVYDSQEKQWRELKYHESRDPDDVQAVDFEVEYMFAINYISFCSDINKLALKMKGSDKSEVSAWV